MTTIKSKLKDHIFCVCPMQLIPPPRSYPTARRFPCIRLWVCILALFVHEGKALCLCENRCSYCMVRCTRMLEQRVVGLQGQFGTETHSNPFSVEEIRRTEGEYSGNNDLTGISTMDASAHKGQERLAATCYP
jgi:hypothetical protein